MRGVAILAVPLSVTAGLALGEKADRVTGDSDKLAYHLSLGKWRVVALHCHPAGSEERRQGWQGRPRQGTWEAASRLREGVHVAQRRQRPVRQPSGRARREPF